MADHSEARERARQDELAYLEWFEKEYQALTLVGYRCTEYRPVWLAGRRSLEQERWISVEERLPDGNEDVLLFTADDWEGNHNFCQVGAISIGNKDEWDEGRVTHWQPLPKAPAPPVHKGDS